MPYVQPHSPNRMSKRTPGPGQTLLEGTVEMGHEFPSFGADDHVSLVSALTPEFYGISDTMPKYQEVTEEMLELIAADSLRPSLINPTKPPKPKPGEPKRLSTRVEFFDQSKRERVSFTACSDEFRLFTGNLALLGQVAASDTDKRRRGAPGLGLTGADIAAVGRASDHAVSDRLSPMRTYRDRELVKRRRLLATMMFKTDPERPENRLITDLTHVQMRQQLSYLRTFIFGRLLTAVSIQRGWNSGNEARANASLDKSIILDRAHNKHISNFRNMVLLANDLNDIEITALSQRIDEAERIIAI